MTNAPKSDATLIVTHGDCKLHDTGRGHPEAAARVDAVMQGIAPIVDADAARVRVEQAEPIALEHVELCHDADYIALAEREIAAGREMLSTGDTHVSGGSWRAALLAAGAATMAVDRVITGRARNAFCVVRPPGHHATSDRGMGFCIFNNAAIAARYAQAVHGLGRVAIIDWDVHHGNGTQDIFYHDPTVLFFSTHQSPLYPHTGAADEAGDGAGKGLTINCPLPAGTGRGPVMAAFTDKLGPAIDRFKPELLIISAGFDSRVDDPLGDFRLEDADFAELTGVVMQMAEQHAGGRVVSCLEGGYGLRGLASASAAHAAALAKRDRPGT